MNFYSVTWALDRLMFWKNQLFSSSDSGGKNLPAVRETWIQILSWGDLLEKGMSIHSSILA